nr:PA0069 family radical SAM protein [Deltaproteobacteria bacterium]
MFRPVTNPLSRFDPRYVDWEEAPPAATLQIFEDDTRSVLSHNDSPDVGFDWSCNPYRGCQHGCAYCYARPSHEYLDFGAGSDFETKIVIKPRAAELLEAAFDKPSWKGEWISFSGNVDCYQPIEAHYGLTRACLEVCLRYRQPCGVITRSAVVERDVDLLAALHREVGLGVTISIPFHDRHAARKVEPMAPTPQRRFQVIARLAERGIPVSVNVAPVIPGLTDQDIPAILKDARAAGARHASIILLRLPGPVSEVFADRMREAFPLRADGILARVQELRGGTGKVNDPRFGSRMVGQGPRWEAIRQLFEVWRTKLGYVPREEHGPVSPFRRPRK